MIDLQHYSSFGSAVITFKKHCANPIISNIIQTRLKEFFLNNRSP